MDQLNQLLQGLPGADLVTTDMKSVALAGALVPDSAGRWPGTPDYVTTHDVYYAALSLLPWLQAQPVVTSAGSEGTSVSVTAPDWHALTTFYRSHSRIVAASGNGVLGVLPIPDGPHVRKTDMAGGGKYYGDVNTDLG